MPDASYDFMADCFLVAGRVSGTKNKGTTKHGVIITLSMAGIQGDDACMRADAIAGAPQDPIRPPNSIMKNADVLEFVSC